MGFVANFIRFQQCKNFKNRLRFDEVTKSLKVGTFLRHSVFHSGMGSSMTVLVLEDTSRTNFGGLGLGLEVAWPWPCPQGAIFTLQPNITVFSP